MDKVESGKDRQLLAHGLAIVLIAAWAVFQPSAMDGRPDIRRFGVAAVSIVMDTVSSEASSAPVKQSPILTELLSDRCGAKARIGVIDGTIT